MVRRSPRDPSFEVSHDATPAETLVVGFSEIGLAGLTGAEYLVEEWDLTETGHVSAAGMPAITPFLNGTPHHHTRIFAGDPPVSVLAGELFVPPMASGAFAEALFDWLNDAAVEEITILSGVPIAHGPEQHEAFYIASEDYREHRLADTELQPMGRGFLDGINAELVQAGVDTDLRVGLLTTPVHPPGPDIEAALRLLNAFQALYDVTLDTEPLEAFAAEVQNHYRELAERMDRVTEADPMTDRMYM